MAILKIGIVSVLLGVLASACTGCVSGVSGQPGAAASGAASAEPSSAARIRRSILERANAVALRIPSPSFEKDRAKMQLAVVECCLANGMLDEAFEWSAPMELTWRRGEALALTAQAYARAGNTARARELAERAAGGASDYPDWAAARVRAGAAKAFVLVGDLDRAGVLVGPGEPALLGEVHAVMVGKASDEELDAKADMFDKAIATRNFDLAKGGIDGYLALLGRVSADDVRRARALKAIDEAIPGLPLDLQVDYRARLAERLAAVGRPAESTAELAKAVTLFETTTFLAEDIPTIGAKLARTQARLGDGASARARLDALERTYRDRIAEIVDLRRATCLRALAEARFELGDRDAALGLWSDALDAGALNPNARPRAEDLCATLVSMGGAATAPTPSMESRIETIQSGLVAPW
jgi:tetratricopeptide (TPR) repeat protein